MQLSRESPQVIVAALLRPVPDRDRRREIFAAHAPAETFHEQLSFDEDGYEVRIWSRLP